MIIAQSSFDSSSTREEAIHMSTIEQTRQGIPTGTWKADTVHSSVAFEVPYAVATFGGEVTAVILLTVSVFKIGEPPRRSMRA